MKRQRVRNAEYRELLEQNDLSDDYDQRNIQLQNQRQRRMRHENVLEAQIQSGDTLQAIALRYNCTISDLKRLNKIEKEFEIHARNTIKVPVNAHTVLLNTTNFEELPIVHKSGQNSPRYVADIDSCKDNHSLSNTSHPLSNHILDEKLLVASVSLGANSIDNSQSHANLIKYSTSLGKENRPVQSTSNDHGEEFLCSDPLISPSTEWQDSYEDDQVTIQSGPHVIRGGPRSDFSFSGSDCDISWICLLVFILALCFAIPLIYIIYIAEHPEQFHHAANATQFK